MLTPRHIDEIRKLLPGRVLTDIPLSRFTSFKIGGPADLIAEPDRVEKLAELLRYLHDEGIPRIVLGSGTNVLFRDEGVRGVVVRTGSLTGIEVHANGSDEAAIVVAAGDPLPLVVSRACKEGWSGLEDLWGIPGSFGGAVATNAGTAGISVADRLISLRLLTDRGEEMVLGREDLEYGYRRLTLPRDAVVVEGMVNLRRGDRDAIETAVEQARARRRGRQPSDRPSAGCVFKNPSPENPAGAIIDRLGFKGSTVGDAQVSPVHANFIVNLGNARARDVLELIETIRSAVKEKEHIDLELEIRVLGGGRP